MTSVTTSPAPSAAPPGHRGSSRRFGDALRALGGSQKSGAGVPAYTRWVNRPTGRVLAAVAYRAHLTPNAVTLASGASSFLAIAMLIGAPVGAWQAAAVPLLLALGYALDSADGQLARLTRTGGPAGEWLDHVLDAVRVPALHLGVLVALTTRTDVGAWVAVVAIVFTIASVGHFMGQILAEQLSGRRHRSQGAHGRAKSLLSLPTDTGVLCWVFVLWAVPDTFAVAYALLCAATVVHTAAALRRKYTLLRGLTERPA